MSSLNRSAVRVVAGLSVTAALSFARGAHAQYADARDEPGRLRIGFNVNGGIGTGQNVSGPTVGSTFRAGWQFDRLSAFYGQITPLVWLPSRASGTSTSFAASCQFTPMYSMTRFDVLELAFGPSLDISSGQLRKEFSGTNFGAHARIAFHLGGRDEVSGRRSGFTIGLDAHPTFVKGGWYTFVTLGLGYDWF